MLLRSLNAMVIFLMFATPAQSKTIRYSAMSGDDLKTFLKGKSDDVAEFHSGDIIHLKVNVRGDFIESLASPATKIVVKKSFFLKSEGDELLLSWDNSEFLPLQDQIRGKVQASASRENGMSSVLLEVEANHQQ